MGIAILNVLVLHSLAWTGFVKPSWLYLLLLKFGSLIFTEGFLFLSGFGLYYSLKKRKGLKEFYLKRIQRLLIPYWIMVLPFFIIWYLMGKYGFGELILRLTTLQFWVAGNYSGMWYISVSVALYIITPLVFRAIDKRGGIIVLLILSYLILWLLFCVVPNYYNMLIIGLVKVPFFFLGIWAGKQAFEDKHIQWYWILLIVILWVLSKKYVAMSWVFPEQDIFKIIGIILCCYFLKWTDSVKIIHSALQWFGSYTLEIYILHLMFYSSFSNIENRYFHVAIAIGCALLLCVPIHQLCTVVANKVINTSKE